MFDVTYMYCSGPFPAYCCVTCVDIFPWINFISGYIEHHVINRTAVGRPYLPDLPDARTVI